VRRREVIALLGGAAAASATWPLAAQAQRPAMPTVGFLGSSSPGSPRDALAAFRRSLADAGFVEGRSVAIDYRWTAGRFELLPALAADLARGQVAAIVAEGGPAARAAKAATTTIPVVFIAGIDPVATGLVASINRPEGNVTGVSVISRELNAKKLELLRELVPAAATIAVLLNPNNPSSALLTADMQEAARALGQQILVLHAGTERDLDAALASLAEQHAGALMVTDDPFFTTRRDQLVALAARHRIPAIYAFREFIEAGGLAYYGTSIIDAFRQLGVYTGRILKGTKPADLPVQLPTKLELIVNLKMATALGLNVPTSILLRADEVIE
jgi:ABC-type uncharacterized transport system substrate-binding protein